jgi:hypothetical protein
MSSSTDQAVANSFASMPDYYNYDELMQLAVAGGVTNLDIFEVGNNETFSPKRLLAIVAGTPEVGIKLGLGCALQFAVRGFTNTEDFEAKFKAEGKEHSTRLIMQKIKIHAMTQNFTGNNGGMNPSRMCRIFAPLIKNIIERQNLKSSLYKKFGAKHGLSPNKCFVGCQYILSDREDQVKFLKLQKEVDALLHAKNPTKFTKNGFQESAIRLFAKMENPQVHQLDPNA